MSQLRLIPHSYDQPGEEYAIECALLGQAIADPSFCDRLIGLMRAKHFAGNVNQKIFESIERIRTSGHEVDVATLASDLRTQGQLSAIGGIRALSALQDHWQAVHVEAIEQHVSLLKAAYKRRVRMQAASSIQLAGSDLSLAHDSFHALADQISDGTLDEMDDHANASMVQAYDAVIEFAKRCEAHWSGEIADAAIPTGLAAFDEISGKLRPKELVVIAAESGGGKSTFALQIADHVSALGHAVAIFSLEMDRSEIIASMVSDSAGVPSKRIREMDALDPREHSQWTGAMNAMGQRPIFIYDHQSLALAEVRSHLRSVVARTKPGMLKLVVLDYLRLFNLSDLDTEEQAISEFVRGCKMLAKQFDCVVLLLAQFNRETSKNQGQRPTVKNLKGSSGIEHNANKIWFIYRQYLALANKQTQAAKSIEDMAELMVEKNRGGRIGSVRVRFDGAYARFREATERDLARWQDAFEKKGAK